MGTVDYFLQSQHQEGRRDSVRPPMCRLPEFIVSPGRLHNWANVRHSVNTAGLVIHSLFDSENSYEKGL